MVDMEHSFTISLQDNGLFCVHVVGGFITTVADCPTIKDATNCGLYAIAKNKEYEEEKERDAFFEKGKTYDVEYKKVTESGGTEQTNPRDPNKP